MACFIVSGPTTLLPKGVISSAALSFPLYHMLFSWLFQPLIRLVKRIHLKTSPPGLRVEGWHQGSTNAAFGSKMEFQTRGLGAGLSSLILNSCSVLEWYSILVWQCLTCTHTHAHSVLSSRTDVMLVSNYIKLPCSVSGLSGEYVEKEHFCLQGFSHYMHRFDVWKRACPCVGILRIHIASQPKHTHTRVVRLLRDAMTTLFA